MYVYLCLSLCLSQILQQQQTSVTMTYPLLKDQLPHHLSAPAQSKGTETGSEEIGRKHKTVV